MPRAYDKARDIAYQIQIALNGHSTANIDGLLYDAALATRAAFFVGNEESGGPSPVTVIALDSELRGHHT